MRKLAVTGFIALLGGLAGAVGGALSMLAITMLTGLGSADAVFFGVAGMIGFAHGVVLGPSLAWLLLRKVPLWRAIGEPAVVASAVASVVIVAGFSLYAASAGALGAAALAALRLRAASRKGESSARRELPR
jgi:hypothetical protein